GGWPGGRRAAQARHLRAAWRERPVRGPAAGHPERGPGPVQDQRGRADPGGGRRRACRHWPAGQQRARARGTGQCCGAGRVPRTPLARPRNLGGGHLPGAGSPAAATWREAGAQRLPARDIPVLVVGPTRSAIASALHPATLLGTQRRLEDAQLAVAVVEVPSLRETSRRSSPRQPREELRLVVHRLLLQEAQRIKATLSPAGEDCFLVIATRGSLSGATDG